MADKKYIVDMFDEIVDNMRHTGTVTSFSESSGTYTITSTNTMHEGWHVTIDSVDYKISDVSSTGFTITGETGVDLTNASWKSLEPYYDYGHPISILSKLTTKDGGKYKKWQKYPLIMLLQDIQESHSNDLNFGYSFPASIVLLATTDKNYTEQERYENVFKSVLYPLYESLVHEVKYYQFFDFETESNGIPTYNKWDRVNWGTNTLFGNTATILNDYLDGIEMQFDPINVYRTGTGC